MAIIHLIRVLSRHTGPPMNFTSGYVTATPLQAQVDRPQVGFDAARRIFPWSKKKLRVAAIILFGLALPAVAGVPIAGTQARWLLLTWLSCIAILLTLVARRAKAEVIVLTVDGRGIFDRRLMPKPIAWQEIEAICPADANRGHVVDLKLRWPAATLAETRWSVRIGAACQNAYGVPAVTISMLLLEGQVSDLLGAIAGYRPDLLHSTNRPHLDSSST